MKPNAKSHWLCHSVFGSRPLMLQIYQGLQDGELDSLIEYVEVWNHVTFNGWALIESFTRPVQDLP
jgi:hypothetical protein